MNDVMGYKKLNEAFQYVSDEFLDLVESEKEIAKKKLMKKKPVWRMIMPIVACLCLLLLPLGAFGASWFGLRDLLLLKEDRGLLSFSLSDYQESQEALALGEWQQFLEEYDPDGHILEAARKNGYTAGDREDWRLYGVYSDDMGAALEEISGKYGLILHITREPVSYEELELLKGSIFSGEGNQGEGFVYENGSFSFEGNVLLKEHDPITYRFSCLGKGVLNEALPMLDKEAVYEEWQYAAASGENVLLVLGDSEGLILRETENSYVAVNIFCGTTKGITKEALQDLADQFDFHVSAGTEAQKTETQETEENGNTENVTLISLSGYLNSPETLALAEWNTFLSRYDADHKFSDASGNGVFLAEGREDWSLYNVWSYEMGEELDRIAGYYGLKLHSVINVIDQEELMYRVGGSFADPDCLTWAYIYEDGFFSVEGTMELAGEGTADFQLVRAVKGTFNETMLNIGNVEGYTEWQYLYPGGNPVLLALNEEKGLIFAESEDCFIAVNVLCGSRNGMSKEDLQELADRIDFGILKDVRRPDMRGDSRTEEMQE